MEQPSQESYYDLSQFTGPRDPNFIAFIAFLRKNGDCETARRLLENMSEHTYKRPPKITISIKGVFLRLQSLLLF